MRAVTRGELVDAGRDLVVAPETARGVVVAVSNREPPAGGEVFRGAEPVADTGAFKRGRRCFDDLHAGHGRTGASSGQAALRENAEGRRAIAHGGAHPAPVVPGGGYACG